MNADFSINILLPRRIHLCSEQPLYLEMREDNNTMDEAFYDIAHQEER